MLNTLLTKGWQQLSILSCDNTLCVHWTSFASLSWFWHYHAWITIQLHSSYHFSFYQCKKQAWFSLLCYNYAWQIFPPYKQLVLTLFRMGFFRAVDGWRGKKAHLLKIYHTYPTMMKLGTVMPNLKKIQKKYESRDTCLEFCWHQHFFTGNQQILLC